MAEWPTRLKKLQETLRKDTDEMAGMLGISPRTLGEFTRPEGREPSEPIQKLVEMIENNINPREKKLTLIIIHSGFPWNDEPDGKDIVTLINEMERAASDGINDDFHFVSLDPEKDLLKSLKIWQQNRVTPHFLMKDETLKTSSEEVRSSYFSAITTWLVTEATSKNLGHVVLAADVTKFWPLAKVLRDLAEIKVSFIRNSKSNLTSDEIKSLDEYDIEIISLAARQHGRVTSIKDGGYGFIEYIKRDQTDEEKWVSQGGGMFFSWNHMRKKKDGLPEVNIRDLTPGDIVSFATGMNDKGPCATDVVLLEKSKNQTENIDEELVSIIKSTINDCSPDETGWVLISSLGTRLNFTQPDYKDLLTKHNYSKLSEFFNNSEDIFEYSSQGSNSTFNAACVRIKLK